MDYTPVTLGHGVSKYQAQLLSNGDTSSLSASTHMSIRLQKKGEGNPASVRLLPNKEVPRRGFRAVATFPASPPWKNSILSPMWSFPPEIRSILHEFVYQARIMLMRMEWDRYTKTTAQGLTLTHLHQPLRLVHHHVVNARYVSHVTRRFSNTTSLLSGGARAIGITAHSATTTSALSMLVRVECQTSAGGCKLHACERLRHTFDDKSVSHRR